MKKGSNYVLFFLLAFFMVGFVYADTCELAEKTELRNYASNVTVSYVPGEMRTEYDDEGDYVQYYIDAKLFNLDDTLRVEVKDEASGESYNLDYHDMGVDGAITIREEDSSQIRNLTFTIYGQSVDCYGTVLRTIRLTLPKFNHLSQRVICEDIPEYYLCQRYVTYDIDNAKFLDNVTKYKEKLEKGGTGVSAEGESAVKKVVGGVSKYLYLIAGVVIISGVLITVYVVKKRRSIE